MDRFYNLAGATFLLIGACLGAVSLVGLVYFGMEAMHPVPIASTGVPTRDGSLLLALIRSITTTASWLTGIADAIVKAFAIASAMGVAAAAGFIQTGRGLRAQKRWAKSTAIVLAPGVAMGAFAMATIIGLL